MSWGTGGYDRYPSRDCAHMIRLDERVDYSGRRFTKNDRVTLKIGDRVLIYNADTNMATPWTIGEVVRPGGMSSPATSTSALRATISPTKPPSRSPSILRVPTP